MVAKTPIYKCHPVEGDTSEVNYRLKSIEETMNSILDTHSPRTKGPVQLQENKDVQKECEERDGATQRATDAVNAGSIHQQGSGKRWFHKCLL